jgi:hypothetical protein
MQDEAFKSTPAANASLSCADETAKTLLPSLSHRRRRTRIQSTSRTSFVPHRQNTNFSASWMTRGSSAVVIVPKFAAPSTAFGAPKFDVFSRLKTSARTSIA